LSTSSPAPVVIAVAPTGARRSKADHPALPVAPAEVARDAAACAAAGAQVIHVHVRDPDGGHTLDADAYRATTAAIRDAVGDALIVQITTEAVGRFSPAEQMATVRALRPEAVSIAVRELIPGEAEEADAAAFLAWAAGASIGVQYIVYDAADIARLADLARRGVIPDPAPHALFVLGRYVTGQRGAPADLEPLLEPWPAGWPWTVCAFGPDEAACLTRAVTLGGHVRVGLENNLLRPDGSLAASNAAQVAHMRAVVAAGPRPLATLDEARRVYRVAHTQT
jgi:uncharacterized protein (DUF849 family)